MPEQQSVPARLSIKEEARLRFSFSTKPVCVVILVSPDASTSYPLLILYILLGVAAGSVVLCWCCWSPGWFLWRVGICRFLPCCNSACASCQLCARSCTQSKDHRPAKVTPHTPVNGTSTCSADLNGTDQNVTLSTV